MEERNVGTIWWKNPKQGLANATAHMYHELQRHVCPPLET